MISVRGALDQFAYAAFEVHPARMPEDGGTISGDGLCYARAACSAPWREDHSREDIYEKHQPEPTSLSEQSPAEGLGINNHVPLIGR